MHNVQTLYMSACTRGEPKVRALMLYLHNGSVYCKEFLHALNYIQNTLFQHNFIQYARVLSSMWPILNNYPLDHGALQKDVIFLYQNVVLIVPFNTIHTFNVHQNLSDNSIMSCTSVYDKIYIIFYSILFKSALLFNAPVSDNVVK